MNEELKEVFDVSAKNIYSGMDLDAPIYMNVPLEFVIDIIRSRKLKVYKFSNWKDIYDNYGVQPKLNSNGEYAPILESFLDVFFSQSWTYADDAKTMRRLGVSSIYDNNYDTQNDVVVRIKTTVKKICDVLCVYDREDQNEGNKIERKKLRRAVYVREVSYLPSVEIEKRIFKQNSDEYNGNYVIDSFFIKRTNFCFERELRIVIGLQSDDNEVNEDYLSFSVDPNDFIEEYMIDSLSLDNYDVDDARRRLVDCGAEQVKIKVLNSYIISFP